MRSRWAARVAVAGLGTLGVVGLAGAAAAGPTNLQQTNGVIWAMVIISILGAAVTYAVLAYAIWKFRDPKTKGRRYG